MVPVAPSQDVRGRVAEGGHPRLPLGEGVESAQRHPVQRLEHPLALGRREQVAHDGRRHQRARDRIEGHAEGQENAAPALRLRLVGLASGTFSHGLLPVSGSAYGWPGVAVRSEASQATTSVTSSPLKARPGHGTPPVGLADVGTAGDDRRAQALVAHEAEVRAVHDRARLGPAAPFRPVTRRATRGEDLRAPAGVPAGRRRVGRRRSALQRARLRPAADALDEDLDLLVRQRASRACAQRRASASPPLRRR